MKIIYFVVGLQILVGCTGKTTSASEANDSTETEIPIEQLFLPDTAYVSAGKLQYVVEEEDSTVNPMKDLDDRYEGANGIFAFRKNLRRDANFGGRVNGVPRDVEIAWEFTTAYDTTHTRFGTWGGGSGWTGQPLYAKWSAEQVARFKQSSPGLTPDFGPEEIMVGSLCGKGYFINSKRVRLHANLWIWVMW